MLHVAALQYSIICHWCWALFCTRQAYQHDICSLDMTVSAGQQQYVPASPHSAADQSHTNMAFCCRWPEA